MKARLIFQFGAPSSEIALSVMRGAVADFGDLHPHILLPRESSQPTWNLGENVLTMALVVQCDSQSDAKSFNHEIKGLLAKNQKANGIKPDAQSGTRKWWQFWR